MPQVVEKSVHPYRTAAPPSESDFRRAWREHWRVYAVRKLVYRIALLGAVAPWLGALADIRVPAAALWLATFGPLLVPLIGYWVTQFPCPSCLHPFTGSDFLGIPQGGAVPFWFGIFPGHCASCDICVGKTLAQAPARGAPSMRPAEMVPAIGRRLRTLKRLGLATIALFAVTAAVFAIAEAQGTGSADGHRERAKRYP